MPDRQPPIAFFLRRETILAAFVLSTVLSGFSDAARGAENAWSLAGLAAVVFAVLAWFTYQRHLLATWATILVLIANGSGFLYDSVMALTGNAPAHPALMIIQAVAGVYLTWGGLVVHRERHREENIRD